MASSEDNQYIQYNQYIQDTKLVIEQDEDGREEYYVNDNGQNHGPYKRYDENGILEEEEIYVYGERQGNFISYMNGELWVIDPFVNDELHGCVEEYKNGIVVTRYYYVNGQRNGQCVVYRDDGITVWEEINYVNGQRSGQYRSYDEDGNIEEEYFYEEGVNDMYYGGYDGNEDIDDEGTM
jgi:antitoxin component YwqK of YwqJK toxin-antitoxin module